MVVFRLVSRSYFSLTEICEEWDPPGDVFSILYSYQIQECATSIYRGYENTASIV